MPVPNRASEVVVKSRPDILRISTFALALAVAVLAGPPARAFTVENQDAAGAYTVPQFDLDEQLRHFRKDGTGSTPSGKYDFNGAFGKGTLEFGAEQRPYSNFGSGIGPMFGSSGLGPSRRDFDRVVAPPSSRDYNDR